MGVSFPKKSPVHLSQTFFCIKPRRQIFFSYSSGWGKIRKYSDLEDFTVTGGFCHIEQISEAYGGTGRFCHIEQISQELEGFDT